LHSWSASDLPCLCWHPRQSRFVAADGRQRFVWDLDRAEARAICVLKGVKFLDMTLPSDVR
jgi:hypothetical protein